MWLTLDVILGIRIWSFIVMHHLHNLQQVIFVQFLEGVGEFVHVDLSFTKHIKQTGRVIIITPRVPPTYVLLCALLFLHGLVSHHAALRFQTVLVAWYRA